MVLLGLAAKRRASDLFVTAGGPPCLSAGGTAGSSRLQRRLISVKDPIEYIHEHDRCIITQR